MDVAHQQVDSLPKYLSVVQCKSGALKLRRIDSGFMLPTKPQKRASTKSQNHFSIVKVLIHTPRKQWDIYL